MREKGCRASVIQADFYGLSANQTRDVILHYKPDVVGFSITQRSVETSLKIINSLRKSGFRGHITVGGYMPTLNYYDLLLLTDSIDSVVIGEGEITFTQLVQHVDLKKNWRAVSGIAYKSDTQVAVNELRPAISELDSLPFPARDLLQDASSRMGYASLISSRGCYGNCTFCSQNAFGKKNPGPRWRGRSAENVVDEIEILVKEYGIQTFKFNDDNIFGPGIAGQQRVHDMCEEIIKRKLSIHMMAYCRVNDVNQDTMTLMREAGFERILLGIESIIPSTLKAYRKGIRKNQIDQSLQLLENLGFSVIPGFMMFNPYSTISKLEKNLSFLRSTKAYGVSISKNLKVHDSTEIKEQLLQNGKLKPVHFINGYHEYIVGNDVARVYMMLKIVWTCWVDPIQKETQDVITRLKKSVSFNKRKEWDDYLRIIWEVQADLMDKFLNWIKIEKIEKADIRLTLKDTYNTLISLRNYLIEEKSPSILKGNNYRIYPFFLNDAQYFLDIQTSNFFQVEEEIQEGVNMLINEQSTANVTPYALSKIQEFEKQGIIAPTVNEKIMLEDIEALTDKIWEMYHNYNLDVLPEMYRWNVD
ncbi:MAG: B12-binding domain-containing radical SAM protein [Desulfobacteraceae bacterium]|nr:B12-binding domain-containing radical SAM protein [Desulfobacteraceae bacterium]